jgi:BA14K-like protein
LAIILPLKASTAWAFPGSSVPSTTVLDLAAGTNALQTEIANRLYYPRYRSAGRGFQNRSFQNRLYRNNRFQNRVSRNHFNRNNRFQNRVSRHIAPRNNVNRNIRFRNDRHLNRVSRHHGVRHWRYDRHHHGRRYAYRHRGYNFFFGGFWYARPWWNYGYAYNYYGYPRVHVHVSTYARGSYSDHVQWCLNRYRSYNPQTDTYTGYDGYQHRCNSPY